jgi:hypothetical protein
MSNTYHPDKWVVFELKGDYLHHRVLAGWSGGYLDGDSWRINSGITKVVEEEDTYRIYGNTGSCYICGKDNYGFNITSAGVWNKLKEIHGDLVELKEEDKWQEDM